MAMEIREPSERMAAPAAFRQSLQSADHRAAQGRKPSVPARGIEQQLCPIEGGTEHRRVGDLAAHPAADAGVVDVRHRILPQRIRIRPDGERGTARQANAGMIARAGVGIDAEALAYHAGAARDGALLLGTLAALAIE